MCFGVIIWWWNGALGEPFEWCSNGAASVNCFDFGSLQSARSLTEVRPESFDSNFDRLMQLTNQVQWKSLRHWAATQMSRAERQKQIEEMNEPSRTPEWVRLKTRRTLPISCGFEHTTSNPLKHWITACIGVCMLWLDCSVGQASSRRCATRATCVCVYRTALQQNFLPGKSEPSWSNWPFGESLSLNRMKQRSYKNFLLRSQI